ncbi:MAG: amino acid adenylation domain-containing protein, partial [Acidobacteria bacterium]|nr:amino acid adenylation domain-containing protein [Acidobacteriota bacterium]
MDLIQRIAELDPEKKKLLDAVIRQKNIDIFRIPVSPGYRKNYKRFPLSFEQEPIWFVEQLNPGNTTYDVIGAVCLEGILNKGALEKSINEIIKRHEILRTLFISNKDELEQVILPSLMVHLSDIDFKNLSAEEKNTRLENLRDDKSLRSFDIGKGPLLAPLLIEMAEYKYIFVIIMHHLIGDLISLNIFFNELSRFYEAFVNGKTGPLLPPLACQYVDYACWQHYWLIESELGIETRGKQEKFWLDMFSGEIPILNIPTDYARPAVKSHEAEQVFFAIKGEAVTHLRQNTVKKNTSLYMMLLAMLYVFLAKISGQEDIVVGTPISSRKHISVNNIIGMFTRTLALRNYPQGNKTFGNFLREVNNVTLAALKNQEYQYEELVSKILTTRDAGRNPLFEVLFNFISFDPGKIKMGQLKLSPFRCKSKRAPFDIELTIEEIQDELFFKLSYSSRIFKAETIQRFISYFHKTIMTFIKDPELKISEVQVMPDEEKKEILCDFNDTGKDLVRDKGYARLFLEQVQENPDKTAALYGAQQVTYRQLNEDADALTYLLIQAGATGNAVIPLYLERSTRMLASIIAAFKIGATYLPIDVDYPKDRIEFILQNSEAAIIITENEYVESLQHMRPTLPHLENIICLNKSQKVVLEPHIDSVNVKPATDPDHPGNLVYLIYTSGTTGKPKGVMIHQLGMINHLYAKINDLAIEKDDIIAQTASCCFDISVWQFLAALLVGGTTAIIDKGTILDSLKFSRTLQINHVTILESVPSLVMAFLEGGLKGKLNLKWMLSTGEPLTPALVQKWYRHYPAVKLVNAYGPTEASDDITHYIVPVDFSTAQGSEGSGNSGGSGGVPIGKPLQNLRIYILDKYLSLCPTGVRGEICVAGIGVGKGYWKDNEKTKAAFMPNPYALDNEGDYKILYKTGDLGYFHPDGHLECLGRLDTQVKIRGNRIELGEIENRLLAHEAVKEVLVMVRATTTSTSTGKEHTPGENLNKYLCAYLVLNHEIPVSQLKTYLAGQLPDYMVPSYFIPLEKFP